MALTAICVSAQVEQKSVRGVVIDTNGNPIAGAEVMATGGGSSAITDADGSFTLSVSPYLKTLTATYAGMVSKKMKVKFDKDMIFNLRSEWRSRGFISLIGNVNYNDYWSESSPITGGVGLMGGLLGKWGVYGKASGTNIMEISVTAGIIKRIVRTAYFYFGVGYGSVPIQVYNWEYYDSYNVDNYGTSDMRITSTWTETTPGFATDLGFIIRPARHFGVLVGFTAATNFDGPFRIGVDAGVVYIF